MKPAEQTSPHEQRLKRRSMRAVSLIATQFTFARSRDGRHAE